MCVCQSVGLFLAEIEVVLCSLTLLGAAFIDEHMLEGGCVCLCVHVHEKATVRE